VDFRMLTAKYALNVLIGIYAVWVLGWLLLKLVHAATRLVR
jgi:hypothetical protein